MAIAWLSWKGRKDFYSSITICEVNFSIAAKAEALAKANAPF
jgi:hypothetical protein